MKCGLCEDYEAYTVGFIDENKVMALCMSCYASNYYNGELLGVFIDWVTNGFKTDKVSVDRYFKANYGN